MKEIGITTTVPVEILLAAGYKPVDLNNIFITSDDYSRYIDIAERDGFPKSSCAWIKGIYGASIEKNIKEVIGVIGGDCSNTKALIEVLKLRGVKFHPFAYPHHRNLEEVKRSLNRFMTDFGVTLAQVEEVRKDLRGVRGLLKRIDELTFKDNKATGFENHLYQVSCSDFNGDILEFEEELKGKIKEIERREPIDKAIRLGFIGVPPITVDLYDYVTNFNAHFVYNEVQREFAFPRESRLKDIYEQYYDYTYPYYIDARLKEIKREIKERGLDGIIHYTQSFCYREIEDIVIKKSLDIPILTISGDKFNYLDSRTELRIEAFLDMLGDLKGVGF